MAEHPHLFDVMNNIVNTLGTTFFESNCYELQGSKTPECFVYFVSNICTKHLKEQEQKGRQKAKNPMLLHIKSHKSLYS